ncbi:MAG: hypothetical protein IJV76_06565 [Clostridia bacterium]|nr:hypothetical protein [Clostridia bacterium]
MFDMQSQFGNVEIRVTGCKNNIRTEVGNKLLQVLCFPVRDRPQKLSCQQEEIAKKVRNSAFDFVFCRFRLRRCFLPIESLLQGAALLSGQEHGVSDLKVFPANGILGKFSAAVNLCNAGIGETGENIGKNVAAIVGIAPRLA